jgi:glycosyltransferase involved in cell wall biosynthesis
MHFPSFPPVPWARPRRALVYTLHDLTWWRWPETATRLGRRYYAPLARRTITSGAHIVTDTEAVAQEIREEFGLPADRLTVVPLGAALPAPGAQVVRPRPYLLAVGTVEPRKNLALLAQAYQASGVSASHDLVVVGRLGWGDLPAGLDVVSGLDDAAVAGMYAGATALVLPSLYEGFGLPAVEAMQLGTPVICSDIPVLREVTGNHAAAYVDPRNLDAWVHALREAVALTSPHPAAAEWSRKKFQWDDAVRILSALYRRLDEQGGT